MRVIVVGATGHIGSFLVPRLVAEGHEVIAISRGERKPYVDDPAWQSVERVQADREAEDAAGTFGKRLAAARPDAVIDLLCFTVASARQLVDALAPVGSYLLHCGTIWVHGRAVEVPVVEDAAREAFGEYGTQKAAIEELLLSAARKGEMSCTVLHPGHIVGPGWSPVNPAANLNLDVFEQLARGEELALPNFGLETVHHVHADDVAQAFEKALADPASASGEAFHVVSERAVTLARLRRKSGRVVRAAGTPRVPTLGELGRGQQADRRPGHLGTRHSQPFDEHPEGLPCPRLQPPVQLVGGSLRIALVASGQRSSRPGWPRTRLLTTCPACRGRSAQPGTCHGRAADSVAVTSRPQARSGLRERHCTALRYPRDGGGAVEQDSFDYHLSRSEAAQPQ